MEFCISVISFSLPVANLFNWFCINISSSCFDSSVIKPRSKDYITSTCFFPVFQLFLLVFCKCPNKQRISKFGVFYQPMLLCEHYLSVSPDNPDIFAVALLKSYCNFSYLIFSPVDMITLYISSNRFFQKRDGLCGGKAVLTTNNEYLCAVQFL